MRKTIFNLHLYTSLASCLILVVVSITGCLLVWELTMDRWLEPKISFVAPAGEPIGFAKITTILKSAFPAQQITEFDVGGPDTSVIAKLNGQKKSFRTFVNPYTGEILGLREGEAPSYWVRHIHRELIGGAVGMQLVRIATFLVLFQSISGIYLWWPLKRVTVKWSGSFRRVNFDLHHATGFFASVFICIIAVTGLLKGYGDSIQPFVDRMAGGSKFNKAIPSTRPATPGQPHRINMDEAVASARAALPGAAIARLTPPKGPAGSFLVSMKFPGDSTAPGRSYVVVDQYSGVVLGSQDARTAPAASQFPIVNRAIHVGGISGAPTRVLAFVTTLAILLQLFTGLVMWWKKRAVKPAAPGVRETAAVSA